MSIPCDKSLKLLSLSLKVLTSSQGGSTTRDTPPLRLGNVHRPGVVFIRGGLVRGISCEVVATLSYSAFTRMPNSQGVPPTAGCA